MRQAMDEGVLRDRRESWTMKPASIWSMRLFAVGTR
jgi:hypothetical protein